MAYLIVKFHAEMGRMGDLDGTVLVTESVWKACLGAGWYASDVLGKHSEVWGKIGDDGDFRVRTLTDEQTDFLCDVLEISRPSEYNPDTFIDATTIGGFNPLYYVREDEVGIDRGQYDE